MYLSLDIDALSNRLYSTGKFSGNFELLGAIVLCHLQYSPSVMGSYVLVGLGESRQPEILRTTARLNLPDQALQKAHGSG